MGTEVSKCRTNWKPASHIWTAVSDFITVWKLAWSIFWTPLSNLIIFCEPEWSITWKKVPITGLIWTTVSEKYRVPVSKNMNVKTGFQKQLSAGSLRILIWNLASSIYWKPVSEKVFISKLASKNFGHHYSHHGGPSRGFTNTVHHGLETSVQMKFSPYFPAVIRYNTPVLHQLIFGHWRGRTFSGYGNVRLFFNKPVHTLKHPGSTTVCLLYFWRH